MIEIEYMASSMILFWSTWSNAFSVKYRKTPLPDTAPFATKLDGFFPIVWPLCRDSS